jgi:hypothetical protein
VVARKNRREITMWNAILNVILSLASGAISGYFVALYGKHHADKKTVLWTEKREWEKKLSKYKALEAQMKPLLAVLKHGILTYPMLKDFTWITKTVTVIATVSKNDDKTFFYVIVDEDIPIRKMISMIASYGFIEGIGQGRLRMSEDFMELLKQDDIPASETMEVKNNG